MKKTVTFLLLILLASGTTLRSQTLDEILKKYFTAIGQDSLLKINSLKTTGKMIQGSLELPDLQIACRPSSIRVEISFQGLTLIQAYNGKDGWSINPFSGATTVQPMSDDDLKSMSYSADFDGMLWKAGEKGYKLTYEGKDDMEGTDCFILKIVTKAGDVFKYYIDSDSYVLLRVNSKIKIMGNESENDSYYSNYMMINGMAIAGKNETKVNGQLMMTSVIDKVEPNFKADSTLFNRPKK
jgi:hypothetical protein